MIHSLRVFIFGRIFSVKLFLLHLRMVLGPTSSSVFPILWLHLGQSISMVKDVTRV